MITTVTSLFVADVELGLTNQGGELLRGMEGTVQAPNSTPMRFRFPAASYATDTFQSFVSLYDKAGTPAAIAWPMRIGGGLATNPSQRSYLAIEMRLATEVRYGYCDPHTDKPVTWLLATDPRAVEIRKCIDQHREEEL